MGMVCDSVSMPPARPPVSEPPVDGSYAILFEDETVAVVAKSGNIPCHAGGRYREHTFAHLLAKRIGFHDLHWVNRLDRETSGTVVVAKTADAASRLGVSLMRGRFTKRYWAIVHCGSVPALPSADSGTWATVCGTLFPAHGCGVFKMRLFVLEGADVPDSRAAVVPTGPGQSCETHLRLLGRRGGFALVEAEPVTGRVHQIRATLRALGLPIVGDKLYGPDPGIYARLCEDALTEADHAALLLSRQALHAHSIAFPHPYTGGTVQATAPLPPDMDGFWNGIPRG